LQRGQRNNLDNELLDVLDNKNAEFYMMASTDLWIIMTFDKSKMGSNSLWGLSFNKKRKWTEDTDQTP
jgi:hypothetical protein